MPGSDRRDECRGTIDHLPARRGAAQEWARARRRSALKFNSPQNEDRALDRSHRTPAPRPGSRDKAQTERRRRGPPSRRAGPQRLLSLERRTPRPQRRRRRYPEYLGHRLELAPAGLGDQPHVLVVPAEPPPAPALGQGGHAATTATWSSIRRSRSSHASTKVRAPSDWSIAATATTSMPADLNCASVASASPPSAASGSPT